MHQGFRLRLLITPLYSAINCITTLLFWYSFAGETSTSVYRRHSFAVAASVGATTAPLVVFVPPVTFPTADIVLTSNLKTLVNITWDASGAPNRISNEALLLLHKGTVTAPFIIAKGFYLHAGSLEVTVPYVLTGSVCYVYGDSGNLSPMFSINSDTPA
ncbi:hypothetical protein GGX14DRAFT_648167 [Mycena pura]|uniref:Uncharacterized protein n=1 Tax=Mycena pura TaxID=153505 RepID=A0AAD6VDG8_9AGAR|nr:hypothetical protein GGX14DRAFT_648167 [Mycena pura]